MRDPHQAWLDDDARTELDEQDALDDLEQRRADRMRDFSDHLPPGRAADPEGSSMYDPLIAEILGRNDTTLDGAFELCRGLMRGHRPDLKCGYRYDNAAIAVTERMSLGRLDALEVEAYALGFARGMANHPLPGPAVQQVREVSTRLADALTAGMEDGAREHPELAYPAEVAAA